jgi:hypothetical protein
VAKHPQAIFFPYGSNTLHGPTDLHTSPRLAKGRKLEGLKCARLIVRVVLKFRTEVLYAGNLSITETRDTA